MDLLEHNSLAVAVAAAVILLIMVVQWRRRKSQQEKRLPRCHPCGYMETFRNLGSPQGIGLMAEWAKELGSAVFRIQLMFPSYVFIVGDPDLFKAILQDPTTTKPALFVSPVDKALGAPSVVTANGERWRHARKCVAPAFAKLHIQRMNRVCQEKLDDWIQRKVEVASETGEALDITRDLVCLTLSVIAKAALEYDMTEEEAVFFVQELGLAIREFFNRQLSNPLRMTWLGYLIDGKVIRRAEQATRNLQSMAKNVLDTYRNKTADNQESGTVIENIVKNPQYKDDEERIADILLFLFGGHDTTAYTLSWTLLELARNPQIMEELRRELERCPTVEERLQCPALDHVIHEAMRLHPVATSFPRQVNRDFCVDDGTNTIIPKGSAVFFNLLIMQRHPKYFDRPDEFVPARWDKDITDAAKVSRALHAFAPFGFGPRNCVGQALANSEVHTVLARLIVDYDFEVVHPGTEEYTLTLKPGGLKLKAIKKTKSQQL